ncbi:MAG: hypothetical protein AB7I30_07525 [Isosphaeraceae bacterium]
MNRSGPPGNRYRSLQASRVALARAAPIVRYGLFGVGLAVFLDQVRPLVSDGLFTWGERRVMGAVALFTLGGFALAGWVGGRLLRASAELIEVLTDAAEAVARTAEVVELHLVPDLRRSASALEALAAGPAPDPAGRSATAVRQAIREGRWGRAERALQTLIRDHPGHPEAAPLAAELAAAQRVERDDLLRRLDVARAGDDVGRAIDYRDALTQFLQGQELHDLDRRTARWVVESIRRRSKAGDVSVELTTEAERAAESFGDTKEGASLLAALPDLRRLAGLCPSCGAPKPGQAVACPRCLGASPSSGTSNRPRRNAPATEP